jgi:hypothetical protein
MAAPVYREIVHPDKTSAALVTAALAYARRGWRVIPYARPLRYTEGVVGCSCAEGPGCAAPGKHPCITNWLVAATTDEATLRAWWAQWPRANLAIATGAASGLVVLDVDPRNGGRDSLVALEDTHGALPPTPVEVTGGAGCHVFLQHPGGIIPNLSGPQAIAPGLDLRGDGGAVVVSPSQHATGRRYQWHPERSPHDVAVAPAPAWLLDLIHQRGARASIDRARAARFTPPAGSPKLLAAVLLVLQARGPVTGPDGRGNFRTRCVSPTHPDRHPSMDVSPRGFVCRSCRVSGGVHALARRLGLSPAGIAALSGGRE